MSGKSSQESKGYSSYYDLELEKLVLDINSNNYNLILLQFPDGLKYYAKEVVDKLREETNAEFFIYFGTCFGGCDIPFYLKDFNFDLCVQWGHTEYIKKKEMW